MLASEFELKQAITNALAPDEKLLWSAQPRPKGLARSVRALTRAGIGAVVADLVFGGLVLAMILSPSEAEEVHPVSMASESAESYLLICGVMLFLMLPSFWWATAGRRQRKRASRVMYAITSARAVHVELTPKNVVLLHAYQPSELVERQKQVMRDGSGDIILSRAAIFRTLGSLAEHLDAPTPALRGFFGIEDVDHVEARISNLVEIGRASSP